MTNTTITATDPKHASGPRIRLAYKYAEPLHNIAGTADEKTVAFAILKRRYDHVFTAMENLNSRNRESEPNPPRDTPLQEYYCIGCDVGDGTLRELVLNLAAQPLLQVLAQDVLSENLTIQCYFAQTYEAKSGHGPGGIIGTTKGMTEPDVTFSRCLKYWNWTDSNEPPYLPEDEAEQALTKLIAIAFSRGMFWLANLPEHMPRNGKAYPGELQHDLIALLGVPAMRRIVTQRLGRELVLHGNNVLPYSHLHWALVTA